MAKKGFVAEFKEFISRGNVMDMAVGVIIGGAFQSIVSSLVGDVVMPVITVITGGISFSSWKLALTEGEEPSYLNNGNFIKARINFLLKANISKQKKHRHRRRRSARTAVQRFRSKQPDVPIVHRNFR